MKFKNYLFSILSGLLLISIFLNITLHSLPEKLVTSTYKKYSITVYQSDNTLKLRYFSDNSLSQEKEIEIEEKISKENIIIEWSEDAVEDNFGELYPKISLNVEIINSEGVVLPFFEWTIYDWTTPK